MRELLVAPRAHLDLLEIWNYIAADNMHAADRVFEKLYDAMQGLIQLPGMGHQREDVSDPKYRFWSVYSYIIAYHYDDSSLTIVRILHGRMNLRKLL